MHDSKDAVLTGADTARASLSRTAPPATTPTRSAPRASALRARLIAHLQRQRREEQLAAHARAFAAMPGSTPVNTDLNRLHLTGTLGCEPVLTTVGDHPLATLTLVAERQWRTPTGTPKRDSAWFTLTAWEELAEQCGRLLHRSDRVYVEGCLHLWPDWRSGHPATGHTIVLDRILLLAAGPRSAIATRP